MFGNITINAVSIPYTRRRKKKTKEMFYLTTDSIHFTYGYMASDIR